MSVSSGFQTVKPFGGMAHTQANCNFEKTKGPNSAIRPLVCLKLAAFTYSHTQSYICLKFGL